MGRMMSVSFKQKGTLRKVTSFLERAKESINHGLLNKYGEKGVELLSNATPADTGLTAMSWYYEIENENGRATLRWLNRNVINHVNIAVIIQYGHATRNGGYVEGIDYINPTMQPLFQSIADEAWKEVSRL